MISKPKLLLFLHSIAISIFILCIFQDSSAQDTTWVQTLSYQSTTRDTMINFPQGDHNQYEKILMYYSMRCKNGLVSTGADRNKGCGEWDYSCNTNVIDSSALDSLKVLHPNFIINGITNNFFYYSTKPTFTQYVYNQQGINLSSSSDVNYYSLPSNTNPSTMDFSKNQGKKQLILIKASELQGLNAGNISGIQFNILTKGTLGFAKIKLAGTSADILSTNMLGDLAFEEVLNRDIIFDKVGKSDILFHTPFSWNGSQNIVVELSYNSSSAQLQNLSLQAYSGPNKSQLSNVEKDNYCVFNSQAGLTISTESMANIRDEVSVSFWSFGNVASLPANTSAFHAVDNQGNRQMNVHLPWSNDRIYWDSGYEAGGYDRIDRAALTPDTEGQWNHWVFTKNAVSGSMKIYLNGSLWHFGTGKHKKLNIKAFVIGSGDKNANPYYGAIDDFVVWDKELGENEINSILYDNPLNMPNLSSNIVAFYDFNEGTGTQTNDASIHAGKGLFSGIPYWQSFRGANVFKQFEASDIRPEISLIKGNFNFSITTLAVKDSIENAPYKVTPFHVEGTALVQDPSVYYWAAGIFPIYNESGTKIGEKEYEADDAIFIENLSYYNKFPSRFELLSFVTPYGIGLDFGKEGKTWIFDVTDFGPILKNSKRFYLDKGGQWQEEMDIKFCYIKGKPSRNVLGIQQIWPVSSYGYTSIVNNNSLEPRSLYADSNVKNLKVRVVTTGHGQEGEFIPRFHSMNVNGGNAEFQWQVWKECADNPVYPQGGTWVYDRAGWCPGAPSDLQEFDITPYITPGSNFTLDYGMAAATGDSRYIINTQLVKYGAPNFGNEVELSQIVNPSTYVEFSRSNPICNGAKVIIKNNGKNVLTKVDIHYGVVGRNFAKHTWTGSLNSGARKDVELPNLPIEDWLAGNKFDAFVQNPNGVSDEYSPNDRKSSSFTQASHLDGDIIVYLQTNGAPHETSWVLKDDKGTEVMRSKPNLNAFTTYTDTIKNLSGCYQLQFLDSDQDGISWWANGDGNGAIRVRGANGGWKFFQPDFGKELTFNFTTGMINATNDATVKSSINVYPNPTMQEFNCILEGFSGETSITLWNQVGQNVWQENIKNLNTDKHHFIIDLLNHTEGLYFLKVTNKQRTESIKIMKL